MERPIYSIYIDSIGKDEGLWVLHNPTGYSVPIRSDVISMNSIKDAMALLHANQNIIKSYSTDTQCKIAKSFVA